MNLFDKITGINSRVIPGRNTTDTFGSASNFFGGTQKSILPQAYTQQAPTQFGMPTQPSTQATQIQQEDPITAQFKAKGYDDKDIEFLKQAKAKGYTSQQAFGYLDSKKKIQQPVQETPITDNFKMKSSEEFGLVEGAKDIGKFFVNVPADSAQVVGGLYDAVRHPINTLSSMYNIGQGISDKAVFSIANSISSALGGKTVGPTEEAKLVGAIGNELVNKYGTAGKFKKAVVENPADTLLTLMGGLGVVSKVAEANNMTNVVNNINKIQQVISPVNILKQESKLITKPLGYAGKEVLPQVLGKTTGTSAETIRTAFTQGGTPEFQSALRGETTPQNILSNVQEGMQAIKNDRAIAYGADYAKLQANKTQLAIDDVAKSFIKSLQDEYKIGVGKNGLDFSQSKITGGTSQSQIENMYKDIVGWKDKTPEGLDVLKQRLQDYYRGTPDSSKGDRLSTIASNAIKQKIVENVPEYANMTANYEKLTNDIRDITKTLSLGDKTQAQTAITKLSSVLRENFSARQDMVKLIEQYTGKNIQGQIAGASLNPLLAKGLAGVITGGGIVFGQLANPTFWGGLALASPRLIGEIANTIGVPIQKFKSAINNIKNANTTSNTSRSAMEGSTKVKPFTKTPISEMKAPVSKTTPKKITPTPEKTVKPQKVEINRDIFDEETAKSIFTYQPKGYNVPKNADIYPSESGIGVSYKGKGRVDFYISTKDGKIKVSTDGLGANQIDFIQDAWKRVGKNIEEIYKSKTIKDPTKTTVNLSQSKGGFIKIPGGKSMSIKGDEALIQEAKKYKTVDDFIKAHPKLYRGQSSGNTDLKLNNPGQKSNTFGEAFFFTTDENLAKQYGKVQEIPFFKKDIISAKDVEKISNDAQIKLDKLVEKGIYEGKEYDMLEELAIGKYPDIAKHLKKPFIKTGRYNDTEILYFPEYDTTKQQLKQIYEQATKPKSIKGDEALMSEARKYKSAEEFIDYIEKNKDLHPVGIKPIIYRGEGKNYSDNFMKLSDSKINAMSDSSKDAISFATSRTKAKEYGDVSTYIVDKNAKIANLIQVSEIAIKNKIKGNYSKALVDKLKELGYDGYYHGNQEVVIINPKSVIDIKKLSNKFK